MSDILCLDLGTKTGWAMMVNGEVISGTAIFQPSRYEGGGMRFLRFNRWLDELLPGVGEVYYEEVRRHAGTDAAHIYGGLMATLTAACEQRNLPYEGIPIGTWKKNLTGKGTASKEQVIASVKALGYDPQDDNEADAIALLLYVRSRT